MTTLNQQRYVTWRLPDRHFSKVHLRSEDDLTRCGRPLPRTTSSPQPPIPEAALCPECSAKDD